MRKPDPSGPAQPRREGFTGQKLVVLPPEVISAMANQPLLAGLFPTATGYFPEAPGHYVDRPRGVPETILIVCESGGGWLQTDERIPVNENHAVLIPPSTPHSYGADKARPWAIRWAHFRGREAPEFLRLLTSGSEGPLINLPPHAHAAIDMAAIYEALEHGYSAADLLSASASLRSSLAAINRLRHLGRNRPPAESHDAIQRSLAWMRRHVDNRPHLAELAAMAALSVPHYSALFRRRTGYAPMDFFLRLKVQRAGQLLDTSPLRIADVAAAVGFEDPYYFSRLFKKITGQSPRDYRKVPKG